MKILFTGGGSGGHIMPIIAIVRELKRLKPDHGIDIHYAGPKNSSNFFLLSQDGIKAHGIAAGKIRRYFSLRNIIDVAFTIPFSFVQSFFLLLFLRPHLVFSKGGTGSLVITYMANLMSIPVFLHEGDIAPGLSNQRTSRWAKKVFISFEKTEYFDLASCIVTGNPIKKELAEGTVEGARDAFGLSFEKPVLLILGGSQGAQAINDFITLVANELLKTYEIIHVCGQKNYKTALAESAVVISKPLQAYYHLFPALDEIQLKHALKAAQLVISRSGSGGIFEVALCGKPSILVPLPSAAANHQSKNAYEYAKTGAAVVIEQENLIPNFFVSKINYLFSHPEELQAMSDAAYRFSKPLAAKAIAREILEYLHA